MLRDLSPRVEKNLRSQLDNLTSVGFSESLVSEISGSSERIQSLTNAIRDRGNFKHRIEAARAILGEKESDKLLASASATSVFHLSLKEKCGVLEQALLESIGTITTPKPRTSSIMELAPRPEDVQRLDGLADNHQFTPEYAVAMIRFYIGECKTPDNRKEFANAYRSRACVCPFRELAIASRIFAAEVPSDLDKKIFESEADRILSERKAFGEKLSSAASLYGRHGTYIPRSRHA
jgi:hypothetical protein